MKNSIFVLLLLLVLVPGTVHASTISSTTDLFENNYTNNLIDMSQTQIDNISNKKYSIVQVNYDYYFVASDKKDVSVSGNIITMNNTTIIRCIRNQTGYNSYYDYSTVNETTTIIYANNIIVSNIDTSKSVSSKRFEDYLNDKYIKMLLMFILGIVFAIFVLKGVFN